MARLSEEARIGTRPIRPEILCPLRQRLCQFAAPGAKSKAKAVGNSTGANNEHVGLGRTAQRLDSFLEQTEPALEVFVSQDWQPEMRLQRLSLIVAGHQRNG